MTMLNTRNEMSVMFTMHYYVSYVFSCSESCRFRNLVCILCGLCVFKTTKCALLLTSDVHVAPLSRNAMVKILCFAR